MIRAAVPADSARIAEIWNSVIRDTTITFTTAEKTAESIAALIADRIQAGNAFLVAVEAGKVLGFAGYGTFRTGSGYVHTREHTVILAEAARGRGLGRALMAALEDHARARGVHAMIGGVSGENAAGIAFHTAIGYRETGRLPETGRKFGRWLDLVFMQKNL
jgi:L-amino acid N-acyltransferase YncA